MRVQNDDFHQGLQEKLLSPKNPLRHVEARALQTCGPGLDDQVILEMRRLHVVGFHATDGEDETPGLHVQLTDAGRTHQFGAAAFQKPQVIRVVDDSGKIGVFVVDAHGVTMDPHPPNICSAVATVKSG